MSFFKTVFLVILGFLCSASLNAQTPPSYQDQRPLSGFSLHFKEVTISIARDLSFLNIKVNGMLVSDGADWVCEAQRGGHIWFKRTTWEHGYLSIDTRFGKLYEMDDREKRRKKPILSGFRQYPDRHEIVFKDCRLVHSVINNSLSLKTVALHGKAIGAYETALKSPISYSMILYDHELRENSASEYSLSDGAFWKVAQPSPGIFHLQYKAWGNLYWIVDTKDLDYFTRDDTGARVPVHKISAATTPGTYSVITSNIYFTPANGSAPQKMNGFVKHFYY